MKTTRVKELQSVINLLFEEHGNPVRANVVYWAITKFYGRKLPKSYYEALEKLLGIEKVRKNDKRYYKRRKHVKPRKYCLVRGGANQPRFKRKFSKQTPRAGRR